MTALFNNGKKWIVRDGDREWSFDSFVDAQKKAAECTAEKLKRINGTQ